MTCIKSDLFMKHKNAFAKVEFSGDPIVTLLIDLLIFPLKLETLLSVEFSKINSVNVINFYIIAKQRITTYTYIPF